MKAQNIFLDENTGGKGRYFKSRFLQAGLVKYSFGVCVLTKETIDKFAQDFVGCPVIINHKDVTNESAKNDRVGVISRVWFDETDGWFWCEGVIFDEKAISLIESGYNVSCQYEITEYSNNTTNALHNGNPYDKVILNGKPEHLAIVETPRYENAMIAVNAIDMTKKDIKAENGWITLDKTDDEGNPIRIYIEGYFGQSQKERERKINILENFKGEETKYDFAHTRAEISDTQKAQVKSIINDISAQYTLKPLAQVEVRSLGGGALGLCTSGKNASIVGLDSSLYSGKYTRENWNRSVKNGFHPKTDEKDIIKNVLTHELGHAISVNAGDKEFWNKIENIRSKYLKDVAKKDTKHPDFISDYARANKYEFVAEAFAQGQLSKKYGKYTKQVMELMQEHFSKNRQLKIAATNKSNENKEDVIIWEEEFGGGYPIDEEAYDELKKEQEKENKTNKNSSAKNTIIQAINEIKETDMFRKLFNKKEQKMEKEELKSLFMDCIQDVLKAQNEAEEEKKKADDVENEDDEKDKKVENKCKNDVVDKRDIIRQIMAIAGKEEASEDVKTIAKLAEKLAYDKSEADGKADNCGKKSKNEEDEKEKEEALNKAKNSIEVLKGLLSQGEVQKPASKYMTKAQAIELGNQLF